MGIKQSRKDRLRAAAAQFFLGIAGLAAITFVCFRLGFGEGRTSFVYLILIALLSLLGSFSVSIVLSILAVACLNYFFVPPLFDLRVDDPDDIVRMAAFLTASLVVTALTGRLQRAGRESADTQYRFEEAQRLAHVGWWERDFTTNRVALSDEVCRIFGLRPVDLPEWHGRWLTLIHPEDRPRAEKAAADALVPGGPRYDVEYRVVRRDGTERVVHSQGEVTWDQTGQPLRQFGVLQDITELRRAEQELRASEGKLERAQRLAHVGWWERDFIQNRVFTSDEVYRIFGVQPTELPEWSGHPLELIQAKLIHPEDRARVIERIAASLKPGGQRYDIEYRVVRPDGAVRILHSQADVTWDETGRPLRQFGALQDITELRQAERELRTSEARFRTIVDYASDAFLVFDENSTVLDVNREACDSLGYSREELIGKHRRDFDAALDEATIQRLKERLVSGEPITFETRHRRKDGTTFPVEVRVGDFEQGGERRFLCLVRDITERKRAEDELRQSEERFRTLVQFSFDVYWETDAQHRFIRQEFAEGLHDAPAPGSEIGKTRWEVPHLEPDEEGWRQHRKTLDAHRPFRDFELARPTPDGGKRYVSVSGLPIFDRSGSFVGYRGVGRHITERKRAEEKLRESEERFRTLMQFSFEIYWETDAQHRLVRQEFPEELADSPVPWAEIGKTRWEAPHVEPDEEGWRKHRETLDAHLPFRDFELARRAADGGKKYVSVSGLPLFDKTGRFTGYRGVARDITERKQAEEALRRSQAYLAEAQRLSHTGTTVFNATGPVYWSEESYQIWGLDPRRGLPDRSTMLQRIHPGDRDRMDEQFRKQLHEKSNFVLEFRIVLPDGTLKHLQSTGHPLLSRDGELIEMLATHVDVTERKRAQQEHDRLRQLESELAHVNRLSIMGELAASLAHEILHPIASARNNARAAIRFLDKDPPNMSEVKGALESIVKDADRGKDIVDRIRDHVKKSPPRRDRFDLNGAIGEVIEMVRAAIEKNRVSVRTRLAPELTSVSGDRVQLQQVVMNLVLNAVEAMGSVVEPVRMLVVRTEQQTDGGILVAVHDSGPGIDPQRLEQVFKPFYTTKGSGVGMGLSICRSIITAHGGRLWAEANPLRGAVFQFTLPAAREDS